MHHNLALRLQWYVSSNKLETVKNILFTPIKSSRISLYKSTTSPRPQTSLPWFFFFLEMLEVGRSGCVGCFEEFHKYWKFEKSLIALVPKKMNATNVRDLVWSGVFRRFWPRCWPIGWKGFWINLSLNHKIRLWEEGKFWI